MSQWFCIVTGDVSTIRVDVLRGLTFTGALPIRSPDNPENVFDCCDYSKAFRMSCKMLICYQRRDVGVVVPPAEDICRDDQRNHDMMWLPGSCVASTSARSIQFLCAANLQTMFASCCCLILSKQWQPQCASTSGETLLRPLGRAHYMAPWFHLWSRRQCTADQQAFGLLFWTVTALGQSPEQVAYV